MLPAHVRDGLVVARWVVWVAWTLLQALHRGLVVVTGDDEASETPDIAEV